MKALPGGEQKMFEAFLKSTQYLLRLQSQQDIWEHLGRFVLTHFPADWLAFVEQDSGNDLTFRYSTLPKGVSTEQILTSEVRALLSDVLNSGFLATRVLLLPAPSMTAFLPIVENGRASRVMMIGHLDAQPLPSGLLGIYLALAGLAGTTTERKRAEEQVRRLNAELERRVEERTMQLQRANEELQREIAEHKRAEEALQEGRAILDTALASMTDAVFISNTNGQFVEFNDAFATFHKFRNKAECAKSLSDYPDILDVFTADGEVAPLEMWAVARALRGETGTNAEYRLRRKDSGETWVGSYSFGPIRDRRGAISGAVVVGRDITEQRRAQEALRESEVLYHSLFNSMDEGFCIIEVLFDSAGKAEDYRFLEVNKAFEKQTGMHDAVGKRMLELAPSHEKYWSETYGRIALTGESAHFENEAKALKRHYDVHAYRVGEAELRQVAIVFSDISGRKRAETALQAALEEKTALLKEVHHRVKNNLQIVSSLLNLQTRQVTNEAALDTLRDTQGRIRAMALLHEALYRENNNGRVNSSVYFSHLCAHLCRAFGQAGERVRVKTEIGPAELGLDVAIPCGLIINELVSNSFKHAFPGGRAGEIVVKLSPGAEGMIHLSVADDGIGLPPGADYEHGSTLGTQLVTGLAKQVGGILAVKSDRGTKVQISFLNPEKGGRSYE